MSRSEFMEETSLDSKTVLPYLVKLDPDRKILTSFLDKERIKIFYEGESDEEYSQEYSYEELFKKI